jgi:antitoxin HicB
MRYAFPANLDHEDDRFTVTFDDLPGATFGVTRSEALAQAVDLLVSALAALVEEGKPIPRPGAACNRPVIAVPALEAAKLALHSAMLERGMSNVELAQNLGIDERLVRRLRDPLHRSHIGTVETALRLLGKRLEVSVSDAA